MNRTGTLFLQYAIWIRGPGIKSWIHHFCHIWHSGKSFNNALPQLLNLLMENSIYFSQLRDMYSNLLERSVVYVFFINRHILIFQRSHQSKNDPDGGHWLEGSYLAWPEEVDINIGIPGDRIYAVLAEVFTHILRGGLRQQPINAFPAITHRSLLRAVTSTMSQTLILDQLPPVLWQLRLPTPPAQWSRRHWPT